MPHDLDLAKNAMKNIYAFFLEQKGKTHSVIFYYIK